MATGMATPLFYQHLDDLNRFLVPQPVDPQQYLKAALLDQLFFLIKTPSPALNVEFRI